MKNHLAALLIGQPGSLRDGMQVLLKAVSQIEKVNLANDISSTLVVGPDDCLAVVFIILNTSDRELSKALGQIKSKWPQARIVILVNNDAQRQRMQETSVDLVLLEGYPAGKLIATIEEMLSQREKGDTLLIDFNPNNIQFH